MSIILKLENISKGYARFGDVSITLNNGEGLLLKGRNGSGKSTLMDIIAGITKPDKKNYTLEINGKLGYAMQRDCFYPKLSCYDNLVIEASLAGLKGGETKRVIADLAKEFGAEGFLQKKLCKCSTGMKARIELIAALLGNPSLLMIDEVLEALDGENKERVCKALKSRLKNGMALILTDHGAEEYAGLWNRAYELKALL